MTPLLHRGRMCGSRVLLSAFTHIVPHSSQPAWHHPCDISSFCCIRHASWLAGPAEAACAAAKRILILKWLLGHRCASDRTLLHIEKQPVYSFEELSSCASPLSRHALLEVEFIFSVRAHLPRAGQSRRNLSCMTLFCRLDVADPDVTCTGMLGNSSCFGPGAAAVLLSPLSVDAPCRRGFRSRCGVPQCRRRCDVCSVGLCAVSQRIHDAWRRPTLGRQLGRQRARFLRHEAFV